MPDRIATLHRKVTDCIGIVKTNFETNYFNFLCEGDVQCRLFLELDKIEELKSPERTVDDQIITPLHTEVTYFDESGTRLAKYIDISAISPSSTNVHGGRKSPILSKYYKFGSSYFLVEIKLNRGNWNKNKTQEEWRRPRQASSPEEQTGSNLY